MTAISSAPDPEIPLSFFDFAECPPALDDQGRAGWPEVIALQAHIMVTWLEAEIRDLRASARQCGTCGGQPCVNPSFCDACRRADARAIGTAGLAAKPRPTPAVTVEAIKQAVRERGVAALLPRPALGPKSEKHGSDDRKVWLGNRIIGGTLGGKGRAAKTAKGAQRAGPAHPVTYSCAQLQRTSSLKYFCDTAA